MLTTITLDDMRIVDYIEISSVKLISGFPNSLYVRFVLKASQRIIMSVSNNTTVYDTLFL